MSDRQAHELVRLHADYVKLIAKNTKLREERDEALKLAMYFSRLAPFGQFSEDQQNRQTLDALAEGSGNDD